MSNACVLTWRYAYIKSNMCMHMDTRSIFFPILCMQALHSVYSIVISLIESDVLLFLLPPVLSCTNLSPLLETTSCPSLSSFSCSLSLCVSLILLLPLPLCPPPPDCAVLRWSKGSSMTRPTPWWTLQRWVFKPEFNGSRVISERALVAALFGGKQIATNSICICNMHFRRSYQAFFIINTVQF